MLTGGDGTLYSQISEFNPEFAKRIVSATVDAFTDQARQFVEYRSHLILTKPVSSAQSQVAIGHVLRATGQD